jgi:formamidopyrimidine-DNA glycosylase
MPELPEVEVTRRSFGERIEGARVVAVRTGKPLRWPLGIEPHRLIGLQVGVVSRRGKYLWLPLAPFQSSRLVQPTAPAEEVAGGGLLLHLGMSGSLAFADQVSAPGPHDHFDLVTDLGTLRLTDPRRFGAVVWSEGLYQGAAAQLLSKLGVEPFDPDFNGDTLHAGLRSRRVAIKGALLGGSIVVGAGNIYACEALHAAGIDPRARSNRLSRPRCHRLAAAVRLTLQAAVDLGGSTLRDFRDSHGMAGEYQLQAQVYGRGGEPCRTCGTPIRRVTQSQRASYFCPNCQKC